MDILSEKEDFLALRDVPHGAVHEELFFSGVTGEWERCLIYTPPVSWTAEDPLPVLYLQHGHGENEIGWIAQGKVGILLDNLLAEGKIVPFAVVMNNGMVQKKDPGAAGGHVVDHRLLEPMLLQDVIPFLEAKYHVGGSRTKRGMAGLSMGSMQTSRMVCRHPELFSEVGIFSGFLHDWISTDEDANAHLTALQGGSAFRNQFHTFFRAMGEHDPFYQKFIEDDRLLAACGVPTTRKIYPEGIHDWNVWRRCLYDFAQMIFQN